MADKNLHDIKIDDLDDNSKKTSLKSILTLLALLFVILIISIVITTLILNTDEENIIENNTSKTVLLNDIIRIKNSSAKSVKILLREVFLELSSRSSILMSCRFLSAMVFIVSIFKTEYNTKSLVLYLYFILFYWVK